METNLDKNGIGDCHSHCCICAIAPLCHADKNYAGFDSLNADANIRWFMENF
jgi:hypothetical protein